MTPPSPWRVQADGKIVAAGSCYQDGTLSDFALARYGNVTLQPDDCDPTKTQLIVAGTAGNDRIKIRAVDGTGAVKVTLKGALLGTFGPTGRVVMAGHAGNDDIIVDDAIPNSAWLYGGAGNDRLKGGAGNDVLLGGEGGDLLVGGRGATC